MSREAKGPTIFHGWFVVAACFGVTLTLGQTFWAFGVFFKPLQNEFGWSRTLTSSAYTVFLIGYIISVIAAGRFADRYSPRPVLFASALLAGLGISLCSQAHSISQLSTFLFIAGLGTGATWSVPSSIVQRWFYGRDRAGMALAIVVSGVGAGALVFAPLINYLILSHGWRNAYLIAGIISFLLIAISSLAIKRSPTDAKTVSKIRGDAPEPASTAGWATGKVVTTASFLSVTCILCIVLLALRVLSVHLVPYATDVGVTPTAAAAALGLMGGFSVPGRIMAGPISDKISWQKTLAISFLAMALSMPWLLFLKATWMLYCFVFFYGIFHGMTVTAHVGILGRFFGMRSIAELIGISEATAQLAGAFAPNLAGFIFDTTGSYFAAFVIVTVFLLGGCFIAMIMKPPPTS